MDDRIEATFPRNAWLAALLTQSLAEDIGGGDASTEVTTGRGRRSNGNGQVVARETGRVAGLPLLDLLFAELDPAVQVERLVRDGTEVGPGQVVAHLRGPARSLLTGERTALNFLQHLGGIATLTARYVAAVAGTGCQILDTRKTLPGYRALAKYAVRCGGGHNHRMGLYDRVMLKDNHWAAAAGDIADLVARSRAFYPELAIEIEVDSLDQLTRVLPLEVEWVLLDNFGVAETEDAVAKRNAVGSPTLLESSGNVTLKTVGDYAHAGVDAASVGRLTHSAPALDLGLDLDDS